MSIRQLDTWVLDCYLSEAGWDGEHQQIYFRTKRDAEAFGEILERRVKEVNGDERLEWSIYKVDPYPSFYKHEGELVTYANKLADEWLYEA